MNDRDRNSGKEEKTERIIGKQGTFRENSGKSKHPSGEWVMSDRPVPGPTGPQEGNDNGKSGS